jgi:hypothetical protein
MRTSLPIAQIAAIVAGLGGLLNVLRRADPRDEAELCSRIGLRMACLTAPQLPRTAPKSLRRSCW